MSGESTGYDSTSVDDLPDGGDWYAGYTDGMYANMSELAARFPDKPLVDISPLGRIPASVVDVEPGCVWPVQAAVQRVMEFRAQGLDPDVYVSAANMWDLYNEFAAMGYRQPGYWTAHYAGPHICQYPMCNVGGVAFRIPVQPIATQHGGDVPGHYDITLSTQIPGKRSISPDSGNAVPITKAEGEPVMTVINPGESLTLPNPYGDADFWVACDNPDQKTASINGQDILIEGVALRIVVQTALAPIGWQAIADLPDSTFPKVADGGYTNVPLGGTGMHLPVCYAVSVRNNGYIPVVAIIAPHK